MAGNEVSGFTEKINEIYAQLKKEQNCQEKRTLSQKLVVVVWDELNSSWSKKYQVEEHSVVIIETVRKCLEQFDEEKKTEFSHYLLAALKRELINAEKKEIVVERNELSIEGCNGENEGLDILDILSMNNNRTISGEDQLLILDSLERVFKKINDVIKSEYDNKKLKPKTIRLESSLLTLDLLKELDDNKFCGLEKEVMGFVKRFEFIDKRLWLPFFCSRGTRIPTHEEVASTFGLDKTRASHIWHTFLERLKKNWE